MKPFVALLVFCLINFSCAMSRKSVHRERKETDKLWRPCQSFETANPIGKFCNRVCSKRNALGRCKKFKTNVKDFSKEKDFLFFRNADMVMINEKTLLGY